jgi:hypothetical protein
VCHHRVGHRRGTLRHRGADNDGMANSCRAGLVALQNGSTLRKDWENVLSMGASTACMV